MITGKRIVSRANSDTDYISVADAKTHLRVTSSADDAYISTLISMSLDMASHYVRYEVRESIVRYGFEELVGQPATINPLNGTPILIGNYIRVPSRVIDVEEVYYVSSDNALTVFTDWIDEPEPLSNFGIDIYLNSLPSDLTDAETKYVVEVTEGFGTNDFDASLKMACMLMIAQYYDNRQNIIVGANVKEMPKNSEFLLDKHKISTFA